PGQGQATVSLSGSTLTITPNPGIAGLLFVTATVGDGYLSASRPFQLTVFSPPTVSAGPPLTATAGSPVSFSQASESGGAAPLSYRWSFGDGTQQTGSLNPSHTYQNPGTYTATLTATDSNNLSGSGSTAVTVYDVAPTVSLSAPASAPAGTAVSFT